MTLWCECDLWLQECVHDDTGACLTHPGCTYCWAEPLRTN